MHCRALLFLSLARAGFRACGGLGLLVLPYPHFIKETSMSASAYFDAIAIAAQHAFESDWDTPSELLPLTIASEAAMLSGRESDAWGLSAWG